MTNLPTIALEEIDPATAEALLTNNVKNRGVRWSRVATYARDMRNRRWQPIGEPILIGADGKLLNGQHRLFAIIDAKRTITLPVIRGLPPSAQDVTDQGLKRSFKDVLSLHFGESNATALGAATVQLHQFYRTGTLGATGGKFGAPSVNELTQVWRKHQNVRESLPSVQRPRRFGIRFSIGVGMALHYLFSQVDAEDTELFFEQLAYGEGLEAGNPILLLRNLLLGPYRPTFPKIQAALVIKAFNAWRRGEHLNGLQWRGGGANPEKFPKIDGLAYEIHDEVGGSA